MTNRVDLNAILGQWHIEAPRPFTKGFLLQVILPRSTIEQAEAHSDLMAEACHIHHETGITPRQLLDQRNELLEALELLMSDLHWNDRGWAIGPLSDGPDSRIAMARAALARATNATKGE